VRGLRQELRMRESDSVVFQSGDGPRVASNLTALLQGQIAACDVFMPILAPAYFQSQWCMNEMRMFRQEKQRRPDLLLVPVRWIDFPVEGYATRFDVAEIAEAIYFDWAECRLLGYDAVESRKMLARFAATLCDLTHGRTPRAPDA